MSHCGFETLNLFKPKSSKLQDLAAVLTLYYQGVHYSEVFAGQELTVCDLL